MRSVAVAGVAVLACALTACAGPSRIEPGICGNAVLEPGEDCDSFTDPALGEGTACVSCRYACGAPDRACPAGWGCALDEICRFASGRYAPGASIDQDADALVLGKVDGDDYPDLVGLAPTRAWVRLGGPDLRFTDGYQVPADRHFGLPALADLTDEGRLDSIVPLPRGFFVTAGSASGRLEIIAQATFEFGFEGGLGLAVARIDPESSFHDVLGFFGTDLLPPGEYRFYTSIATTNGQILDIKPLDNVHTAADITGLAVAHFDPATGGEDLALAFDDEAQVRLFQTNVDPVLGRVVNPAGFVALTDPVPPEAGLYLADLDRDGAVDLLVPAGSTGPNPLDVAVGWGDGAGAFTPPAPWPLLAGFGWPLAIGDFNRDDRLDFVYPSGVYLDLLSGLVNRVPLIGGAIKVATVVDINNDGIDDVAGGIDGASRLLIGISTEEGHFTGLNYETDAPIELIHSGDFDGDAHGDVAFVGRSSLGDSISIVYGAHNFPIAPPVLIGRFETIEDVVPATFEIPGFPPDIATDMLVTSSPTGTLGEVVGVYVQFGNAMRQITSGFDLVVNPRAVMIGRFSPGPDAHLDAMFVTEPAPAGAVEEMRDSTFQLVHGRGNARFHGPDRRYLHAAPVDDGTFDLTCALWRSADLDGDAHDDLVALTTCGEPLLLTGRVLGTDEKPTIDARTMSLADLSTPTWLSLADVDTDGRPDVVVAGSTGLWVYWNEDGAFDPARRAAMPAGAEPWLGAATLGADGDPDNELAVVSTEGVYVAQIVDRGFQIGAGAVTQGGFQIWAGDVDRDQLDDLIVTRTDKVDILLAVPHDE